MRASIVGDAGSQRARTMWLFVASCGWRTKCWVTEPAGAAAADDAAKTRTWHSFKPQTARTSSFDGFPGKINMLVTSCREGLQMTPVFGMYGCKSSKTHRFQNQTKIHFATSQTRAQLISCDLIHTWTSSMDKKAEVIEDVKCHQQHEIKQCEICQQANSSCERKLDFRSVSLQCLPAGSDACDRVGGRFTVYKKM